MKLRRPLLKPMVVVLAIALSVGLAGCNKGGGDAEATPKEDKALRFTAQEVTQPKLMVLPELVEFSGPLSAVHSATVRSKAAAALVSLDVAEGQRVRAGQQLGRLDLADALSRVDDRQANLASARAQLANAERTHANNERLASQNFISSTALEASKSSLESARAAVRSAEALLTGSKVQLRDAALTAPIDGIVSKRHVVAGEKLAFDQPVVTIVDLRVLEIAGAVGTHEVSRLKVGMPVSVKVEGIDKPLDAKISRIAPAAESGTRSIGVFVRLENPSETLKAGQFSVASVNVADTPPTMTIPTVAVFTLSGQDYVWTVENSKLTRRIVTTGRKDAASGRVEVLSGLPKEATILAQRFDGLKEGSEVAVLKPGASVGDKAPVPAVASPAPAAATDKKS
jgi:RND family efflux transporter MFP subunit